MTPRLSGRFSIFWFAFLCAQVYSGNCQTMEYIERGLFATTIFGAIQRCNIVAILFQMVAALFQHLRTSHMSLLISRSEDRRTGMITKNFRQKHSEKNLDFVQNTIFELIFIHFVFFFFFFFFLRFETDYSYAFGLISEPSRACML